MKTLLIVFSILSMLFLSLASAEQLSVNVTYQLNSSHDPDSASGILYMANTNHYLSNVTRSPYNTATICSIIDSNSNLTVVNSTWSNNVCNTGNLPILAGRLYRIMTIDVGGLYSNTYNNTANIFPRLPISYPSFGNITGGCYDINCAAYTINSTLYGITGLGVSSTAPPGTITTILVNPSDGQLLSVANTTIIANATPAQVNLTNITFYLWYNNGTLINQTTNTLLGNVTNTSSLSIEGLSLAQSYKWNARACGINSTGGGTACGLGASNFSFTVSALTENGNTTAAFAYETSNQYYDLNITTNAGVLSITGNLWYNGTRYEATISGGSSSYVLSRRLDVPAVTATTQKNLFWEIISTTSTSLFSQNSSLIKQYVNNTQLTLCSASIATNAVNLSTYNATSPFSNVNTTMYATWNFWLGGGSEKENYSYQNTTNTISNHPFCISENMTYYVDLDAQFVAPSFAQNYHYYRNASINNTVLQQPLYLLSESMSTLTELKVLSSLSAGLPDRLIFIQLYDVGTNTYKTVGMANTNFEGSDIAYLNWYDSFYKFIVVYNGTIVYTATPYKIAATPQVFRIADTSVFSYAKFGNVQYTLTFNNITNNFVLTYVDPSGAMATGCLRVVKASASNYTTVSNQCSTSSSATLSYTVAGNGTYFATFYGTGSDNVFKTISAVVGTLETIYEEIGNLDGSMLALIIVGTAAFVGLFSAGAGIVMMFLGYGAAAALGFQGVTEPSFWFVFVGAACVGGYLVLKLRT